jgi:hypothetical protein
VKRLRKVFDQWVVFGRPKLVRLQPGDVIVIEAPGPLSVAQTARLRLDAEDVFGYHHDVLILDAGAKLTVVTDMEKAPR